MANLQCYETTRVLVTSTRSLEKGETPAQEVCDMLFAYQNFKTRKPTDEEWKFILSNLSLETSTGKKVDPKESCGIMTFRISLAAKKVEEPSEYDASLDYLVEFAKAEISDHWIKPINSLNKVATKGDCQAYSVDDNNFVDSLILGEAVHSWIKNINGSNLELTRFTNSNLPMTRVKIAYHEINVGFVYFMQPTEDGLGYKTQLVDLIVTYSESDKVINLNLVNRSSNSGKGKRGTGTNSSRQEKLSKKGRGGNPKEDDEVLDKD